MTLVSKAHRATFTRRRLYGVFGGLLGATVWFCAAPARAEDAETRTAARDLATQGAQAFDAGRYDQASDFFLRAYELVKAPSIALMRARSLTKLGQLLEAIDVYEQTARVKLPPSAPDAYVKAVKTARSEVEDVRSRVPRLKLTLTGIGPSETPEVTIDDKPTPAALLGVERPMNPGSHHVAVLVSGETRATRELSLEEGKSYNAELDASAKTPAPVAPTPEKQPDLPVAEPPHALPVVTPSTDSSQAPASSSARTLGYVGVGVGAVGLALGTYTGLVALHHKSQLDEVCHPGCPQSSADDLNGFRSNRTVSWLSYGVGIAAGATGVLLLTLGHTDHEHVALRVVPGGVQIGGRL
jgi:hypothetical protein